MPRFPSFTPRKLIKTLNHFGFELDHAAGSHFVFYNVQTKKRVVIPFHRKDLPKGTLLSILKEAGISQKDIQ